jgi:hypothetical protein
LVAAIEIVSPSNKDRPESRGTFVSKVATLLKHGICVSIVDVVSTSDFNLYAELLSFAQSADPALGEQPSPLYAVTVRTRYEGRRRLIDSWYHRLTIGQPLPSLNHLAQGNLGYLARSRRELRGDLPDAADSVIAHCRGDSAGSATPAREMTSGRP